MSELRTHTMDNVIVVDGMNSPFPPHSPTTAVQAPTPTEATPSTLLCQIDGSSISSHAPAAIVVMHMKYSTLPVVCLKQAFDAITHLEAQGVIASNPEPVLADWNAYPLQPNQSHDLVLAIHCRSANGQLGELITKINVE